MKKLHLVLACITFFLILTAQLFWSTIHGDGAVYAWIVRQIAEAGFFSLQLPKWTPTLAFAEHPYLFFYLSGIITKIFGYSDVALKIPNFLVAILSLFTVYKICVRRGADRPLAAAATIGLISAYCLIFDTAYTMQVSQPSLDPLAQLLGLFAVLVAVFYARFFFAGLILGLAFLTKGLEMLPNLAALFLLVCYLEKRDFKSLVLAAVDVLGGTLLPVLLWLAADYFLWDGQWTSTYWSRQFTNRFFTSGNMQTFMGFAFFMTFVKTYIVELVILGAGLLKSKLFPRRHDTLFLYFLVYIFFNTLAFMIIKKDSSQHLTGVLLLGSVFVGEYLWEFGQAYKKIFLGWKWLAPVILGLTLVYWGWFMLNREQNPDEWTAIKLESARFDKPGVPLVVQDATAGNFGFFYTIQWYFRNNPVYFTSEANGLLVGREVVFIRETENNRISQTPMIYRK